MLDKIFDGVGVGIGIVATEVAAKKLADSKHVQKLVDESTSFVRSTWAKWTTKPRKQAAPITVVSVS